MKKWLALILAIAMAAGLAWTGAAESDEAGEPAAPVEKSEPAPSKGGDAGEKPAETPSDGGSAAPSGETSDDGGGSDGASDPGDGGDEPSAPEDGAGEDPVDPVDPDEPGDPGDSDEPDEPGEAPGTGGGSTGGGSETPSEDVLRIQEYLVTLKYLRASQKTGVYDDDTEQAVRRFQADMAAAGASLAVTGVCDRETLALLAQKAAEAEAGGGNVPGEGDDTPGEGDDVPGEGDETPGEGDVPGVGGFPGGFPGGFSWGGFRRGGFRGASGGMRGAMTGAPEDDGLNGITPGEALTSSHASGDKDASRYGTVDLEAIAADGGALDVALRTGADADSLRAADFAAAVADGVLTLDGGADAVQSWTFDGMTLRALSRSGVDRIALGGGAGEAVLSAGAPCGGAVYEGLRARGWTDNTFAYSVTLSGGAAEIAVEAGGERYAAELTADGTLVLRAPEEGED